MKAKRKNLKLEQRIDLARRYQAGEPAVALAAVFGVTRRHVVRVAKEQTGEGLSLRDPSETVAFRATQSELAAFDAEWRARGFANRSQALNAVLRGRCGFLDLGQGELASFAASWRQAKDLSNDLRCLAKAAVLGKLTLSDQDRDLLIELADLTRGLSREMGRMKDAARVRGGKGWDVIEEAVRDA
ncbi:hypothetical protein A8B82_19940 [Sulfitobacter sp. EhC04]|uniref:hypothetical protein n=1 Tax=Sulfitobacter sp. EhC04 TaxID=1849168 RepID=UPI0007F3B985|nr:hypothetical protein [Sulfitobacter sp. EhC04]OAN72698.1 hypothetical protein A8B82_19940 [Sulfitobacter sp. EhC04]